MVGPGGLRADGADVALFDVEVVDSKGLRARQTKAASTSPCADRRFGAAATTAAK